MLNFIEINNRFVRGELRRLLTQICSSVLLSFRSTTSNLVCNYSLSCLSIFTCAFVNVRLSTRLNFAWQSYITPFHQQPSLDRTFACHEVMCIVVQSCSCSVGRMTQWTESARQDDAVYRKWTPCWI